MTSSIRFQNINEQGKPKKRLPKTQYTYYTQTVLNLQIKNANKMAHLLTFFRNSCIMPICVCDFCHCKVTVVAF